MSRRDDRDVALRLAHPAARRQIRFRSAAIGVANVGPAALAGPVARLIPYEFTGDVDQDAISAVLRIIASSMLAVATFSLTAMESACSSATQLATRRATQLMIRDHISQSARSSFLGGFIFATVGVIGRADTSRTAIERSRAGCRDRHHVRVGRCRTARSQAAASANQLCASTRAALMLPIS